MHYKKVTVYTFCQSILARVDNCNWIFIAQLYRAANENNCILRKPGSAISYF